MYGTFGSWRQELLSPVLGLPYTTGSGRAGIIETIQLHMAEYGAQDDLALLCAALLAAFSSRRAKYCSFSCKDLFSSYF